MSPQATPPFVIRPTTKFVILGYVAVGLLTLAAVAAAYYFKARTEAYYAIIAVDSVLTLWVVARHMRLQFTRLTLEPDGLRFEEGFLSKSTRLVNLGKVQDVRVNQGILERMMGIGTITLETAGESGRLEMDNIDHPQDVAHRILNTAKRTAAGRV